MSTTFPFANEQKKSRCQHLELCTRVWVGKSPPLLMGRKKSFATSGVIHQSLGVLDSPLANEPEKSGLQYLKSCTGVSMGKTSPLLLCRRKVVHNI